MRTLEELQAACKELLNDEIVATPTANKELWITVNSSSIKHTCQQLGSKLGFEQLIDIVGIDYLQYGQVEWQTTKATGSGFSRASIKAHDTIKPDSDNRFAVVYHLLSVEHNLRLSVKCFLNGAEPKIDSVVEVWSSADWHEREVFDMFGVMFLDHPDLRRILTDYGFIGNPFRKDFPLNGNVEMRYDENLKRVVYGPVEISPRVNTPRVIRYDNRYATDEDA